MKGFVLTLPTHFLNTTLLWLFSVGSLEIDFLTGLENSRVSLAVVWVGEGEQKKGPALERGVLQGGEENSLELEMLILASLRGGGEGEVSSLRSSSRSITPLPRSASLSSPSRLKSIVFRSLSISTETS